MYCDHHVIFGSQVVDEMLVELYAGNGEAGSSYTCAEGIHVIAGAEGLHV